MKKNYSLYLGLNDKDSKKQLLTVAESESILNDYLLNRAGVYGATVENVKGVYTHENGDVVVENTLKITLCYISKKQVLKIASDLKELFNQESIMIQKLSSVLFF